MIRNHTLSKFLIICLGIAGIFCLSGCFEPSTNKKLVEYMSDSKVVAVHYYVETLVDNEYVYESEELPAEKRDFEIGYKAGFELGRQRAIADVIKCVKEMRTYGGDSKKRADEVPDHPAGRPADMQ